MFFEMQSDVINKKQAGKRKRRERTVTQLTKITPLTVCISMLV